MTNSELAKGLTAEEIAEWCEYLKASTAESAWGRINALCDLALQALSANKGERVVVPREQLGWALSWLQSALTCKAFTWDADQQLAAQEAHDTVKAVLAAAPPAVGERVEPVAEVTYSNWNGMNVCLLADPPPLPVGTKLYASPPADSEYRRGLEDAAKVARDKYIGRRVPNGYDEGWDDACSKIEVDIRALIPAQRQEGGG